MQSEVETFDPAAQTANTDGFARKLVRVVGIVVAVKCLVAWCFPFMGDEAYYLFEAKQLSLGYYDHPPLVMWLLHAVLYLGQSPLILRLPTIAFTTVVGVMIYVLLKPYDRHKAYLTSVLFLVSPLNSAFFVISTDTPLLLASFVSAYFLFQGERSGRCAHYALCGVFLGLAFLSKYFALLLGLSYVVCFLSIRPTRRRLKCYGVLFGSVVPFVAQNVIWNYRMGWPNFMHNWVNRFRSDNHPVVNYLMLALVLLYFLTPQVIYCLIRNAKRIVAQCKAREFRVLGLCVAVPILVFVIASFRKTVWPHWLISFFPFIYIVMALPCPAAQIRTGIRSSLTVSIFQVVMLLAGSLAAAYAPLDGLKNVLDPHDMASGALHLYPRRVLAEIDKYDGDLVLATTSYQMSVVLEYYADRPVIVFGFGSRHARQDDIRTDFRELQGQDILILYKVDANEAAYKPYFERAERHSFEVEGARFTLVAGYGFQYQPYRDHVLKAILEQFYHIPGWLPGSRSFFHERYGFSRSSRPPAN